MARDMSNTSVLLDQIMHNLHNRVGALEAQSRYIVDLDDANNSYSVLTDQEEPSYYFEKIDFEHGGGVLGIGRTKGYLYDVWFFGTGELENQGYVAKLTESSFKSWFATKLARTYDGIDADTVERSVKFSIPGDKEAKSDDFSRSGFVQPQFYKYTNGEEDVMIYHLILK